MQYPSARKSPGVPSTIFSGSFPNRTSSDARWQAALFPFHSTSRLCPGKSVPIHSFPKLWRIQPFLCSCSNFGQCHGTALPPWQSSGSLNLSTSVPGFWFPAPLSFPFAPPYRKAGKSIVISAFLGLKTWISSTFWQNSLQAIQRKSYVYVQKGTYCPIPPDGFCENSRLRGRRFPGDGILEILNPPPLFLLSHNSQSEQLFRIIFVYLAPQNQLDNLLFLIYYGSTKRKKEEILYEN